MKLNIYSSVVDLIKCISNNIILIKDMKKFIMNKKD